MLAIVIPFYKFTFFEATLQSLANQTDKRFKVYIGDDSSPDNPKGLLEKYKGKFDFLYHRFQENLGGSSLTKQWERCIELSGDEEWIMILGDDDYMGKNVVAAFYENLETISQLEIKVVRFATRVHEADGSYSKIYNHPKLEKASDFLYRRFTNVTRSSLSEYVFKKTAYKKYGFYNYDLAWFSDDRAWLEISENKYIYSINSTLVYFRLSDQNISRNNYKSKEKESIRLMFLKFIISNYLRDFNPEQKRFFLIYYEQLVYKNNEVNLTFWIFNFCRFTRWLSFIDSLKFTRRIFNYAKNRAK